MSNVNDAWRVLSDSAKALGERFNAAPEDMILGKRIFFTIVHGNFILTLPPLGSNGSGDKSKLLY